MKRKSSTDEQSYISKGNVLDDLGFSPDEVLEIKVKADIYRDLLRFIRARSFTQQELGAVLGIHQPDVSNLLNGRLSKFSVGKLIKFAGKLNLGAEVRITKPKVSKVPGAVAGYSKSRRRKRPLSVA